jgi:hypothetical protein
MVGARCACPISGAKHRAPTPETILSVAFSETMVFDKHQKYSLRGWGSNRIVSTRLIF